MKIIKAPHSYRMMQYGQCRTFADIVETLNKQHHYSSFDDLMNDFGCVIGNYIERNGDCRDALYILENTLKQHETILFEKGEFRMERFLSLLEENFHDDEKKDIDAIYTRRMMTKILFLVKTLNDVCLYQSAEELRYDMKCIATGRMNCGDNSYMADPYPTLGNWPINWFVGGLKKNWNRVTVNGILDNELMEKYMFSNHADKVASMGIDKVIEEDYISDGPCHPEVFYPKDYGTAPVYVKDDTSRRYLKACGEGKGPRNGHDSYEMDLIGSILLREVNKGEYQFVNGYYLPTTNYRKPIFKNYHGRLHFDNEEEKKAFIAQVLHSPN